MKPRFVVTSEPQRTILELVLEPEPEAKAELELELSPVLDFVSLEPQTTIFYLRFRMQVMWEKYCYATQHETSPVPPLPPVRWIHR